LESGRGTPAELESELRDAVRGEVLVDVTSRGIYATDASHYQVMPTCVVLPRDEADVLAALRIANDRGLAVTARGGGTSLSGQTTWTGMVLDFTKFMHDVLEVNAAEQWVRVQPGVVRDELNRKLRTTGLHFAPDPATGSRAAVGGMVGNNTSGTRSIVYGKTSENIVSLRVALMDGTVCEFAATSQEAWLAKEARHDREGELYRGIRALVEANMTEIAARYPTVMRRVSGYALDAFLPGERGQDGPWNLSHLIVGSEGTLGVLLEAKLKLRPPSVWFISRT
jgi:FAD/FMN-containing dehydrogenase